MFKITVLSGAHIEKGKTYKKGQSFLNERDLSKVFPQKFKAVEVEAPAPKPPTAPSAKMSSPNKPVITPPRETKR